MPDGPFTWFATAGSEKGDDFVFFGLVMDHADPLEEWGHFGLGELEEIRGALGLPVERDRHFRSKPLRQLNKETRC